MTQGRTAAKVSRSTAKQQPRARKKAAHGEFDIVIAGGGMVGASLAAALAPLTLDVAVVEAVRFGSRGQPSYDERVTAVSWGSRRIFEGIGVWPQIAPQATPIHHIHVSDQGHLGMTHLEAEEMGVEALGYVVPNRVIGSALNEFLAHQPRITLLAPAKLASVQMQHANVEAELEGEGIGGLKHLKARLLVAADGVHSQIRQQLGIKVHTWDYGQSAVICNISVERPQVHTAYERFSSQGPLALLPMGEDRYALIWTVARDQLPDILALDDAGFLSAASAGFNGRLGKFLKMGQRQTYPLSLVRAATQWQQRILIAGNAAHSLHPIAGQGFNLSLRDVAVLADTLADISAAGGDIGNEPPLAAYVRARRRDQWGTALFTDMLTRLFTNPLLPVGLARNLGLLGLELCAPARRAFTRFNLGLAGRQPRLARGLALSSSAKDGRSTSPTRATRVPHGAS